jgi:hypothetical protein
VVVIVCGGSCVTIDDIVEWSQNPSIAEPNIVVRCGQEVYLRFWGNKEDDSASTDAEVDNAQVPSAVAKSVIESETKRNGQSNGETPKKRKLNYSFEKAVKPKEADKETKVKNES